MNLELGTIDIWIAESPCSPSAFFHALHHLLEETDILVLGSYEPDDAVKEWFSRHELRERSPTKPYDDFFDLNRDEYPQGRSWHFMASRETLTGLGSLIESLPRLSGSSTCIDHILAFREQTPVVPLLNFRQAFRTGDLHLSGHFVEAEIRPFALESGFLLKSVENPVLTS